MRADAGDAWQMETSAIRHLHGVLLRDSIWQGPAMRVKGQVVGDDEVADVGRDGDDTVVGVDRARARCLARLRTRWEDGASGGASDKTGLLHGGA